jgi:hypothetical protein
MGRGRLKDMGLSELIILKHFLKAEAVPLHVMKAPAGRGIYLVLIHNLGTRWG